VKGDVAVEHHPKVDKLAGFLEGRSGRSEKSQARVLVAHLLHGCSECAAHVEQILRPSQELPPSAYDEAFERAAAMVQAHQTPVRPLPNLAFRRGVLSLPGSPI
jgi:hypothetical protein